MKTIKKAQTGVKQKPAAKSPVKKGPRRTTSGMWVDEDKFQPPFPVKYADEKPKVKAKVKAKNGAKFPDLNKDGKITKADILKGRGVIAKKGVAVKKAQDGYTGKQNRLARQEKRVYNRYTDAKASGNIKKSGRLYDKLIDKQTKSIKAGVDVQYKSGGSMKKAMMGTMAAPMMKKGGSMKKCRYGCK